VTIVTLASLCWWYVAAGTSMPPGSMRQPPTGALALMWWLMMIAMMLPSAAPAILLYSRVREIRSRDSGVAPTWIFLAGYVLVWLLFSVAAALVQKTLAGRPMLDNHLVRGALLFGVGLYQLSPLKAACLGQCRSPGQFLSRYWRPDWDGAIRLGVRHGLYCLGCCWLLMALLFVGGMMNLLCIGALTLLVAAEKLLPNERFIRIASAGALLMWGSVTVLA